jgi:benzoylformate decarboxylase
MPNRTVEEKKEYTGADLFVDVLESYGVDYVFGNPGTTELPILEAVWSK